MHMLHDQPDVARASNSDSSNNSCRMLVCSDVLGKANAPRDKRHPWPTCKLQKLMVI